MQKKMIKLLRMLLKSLALIILIPLFFISLQYFNGVIYEFGRNEPFQGNAIYNPYEEFKGEWLRGNFHCHSLAWGGITNGNQPPREVYEHYYQNGYDVLGLSNYQQISAPYPGEIYMPTYEHGVNIKQNHHIVINSSKPSFADFFLWQNAHQKQWVIKKLRDHGGMIAIAHPGIRHAFTEDDMWKIRGYDLIEVLNHYKKSFSIWDAALSSGVLCWLMANDDSHNISKENETCVHWTMIGADERNRSSILAAMRKGRHYGVDNRKKHINSNYLDSAKVIGNTVHVYFQKPADEITFIGDHGIKRKTLHHSQRASYMFAPEDTYIRVKAKTNHATLYLNPFLRYDGNTLPTQSAIPPVNIFYTILYRIQVMLVSSLLLMFIFILTGALKLARAEKGLRLSFRWVTQKKSQPQA